MEFKFRAVDGRPQLYPSSSSGVGYFTEQALRAGISTADPNAIPEQMRNPSNVREAIQRELEKERIREEIIMAEIARRQMLEAEVRRELMMEREMVMRRLMAEGLSVEPRLPSLHPFEGLAFPGHGSGFDMFTMPASRETMVPDIKNSLEVNKDKLILLAKPNSNLSGAKQKAVTPPAGSSSELQPYGLKKRPKEEWSCALCKVSATNERGFNDHLQGKKHKAKETGLRAKRMGKIASSIPPPKETSKPSQLTETTVFGSLGLEARVEEESLQQNEIGAGSDHKIQMTENLKKNEQVPVLKKRIAENSKKRKGTALAEGAEKTTEYKKQKQFKFWCAMCQIGAYSQVVMEAHEKGKKHRARLQNLRKKDGVGATTIDKASSDDTQKAVDTDLVAKAAKKSNATQKTVVMTEEEIEKTTTTVDADAENSGSLSDAI
ncbi:UBP1-associated proteins 1C-like isoform X1 [Juglans microcarpa x Juglans regia]|uniref:UBP1-associated proteins 1C-like isoform X1 n=1 Tax=Juglans microcarpa x Juglans regia TaxID=2249226 RepID=UPI001B7F59E2|nr:UBP1-associated proteins 1C-like isoform X1 [Juglans microcarpa x Juglans regia]